MARIFNDTVLIEYLKENAIPYQEDARGFISLLPDKDDCIGDIEIDDRYIHTQLNRLVMSGSIVAGFSRSFVATNLQQIQGSLVLPKTNEIHAPLLTTVKGAVIMPRAKNLNLDSLESSAHIQVPPSFAGKQKGSWFFEDKNTQCIFNENTNMFKIHDHQWMSAENVRTMQENNPWERKHDAFLNNHTKANIPQ